MAKQIIHISMRPILFSLSSSSGVLPPLLTILYILGMLFRVVQDSNNEPGNITMRHRFCAVARMKMALCLIKFLAAEMFLRKLVLGLHELITSALNSFYRMFILTSLLARVSG